MEHHTVGVWQAAGGGTSGDDTRRFLSELRQLRDLAGLEQAELAARAHYPHDYIRAAETGPTLPDLPLLSAYVRGCGGTTDEWEERWRVLTNTPALTLLPIRSVGASTAASQGARVGLAFQDENVPDPAMIMAALNRVAEKIAADTASPPRSTPSAAGQASTPSTTSVAPAAPAAPVTRPSAAAAAAKADAAAPRVATTAPRTPPVPTVPKSAVPAGPGPAGPATASADAGPGADPGASPAVGAPAGRSFSLTSRATVATLIALAICVIVAVLAIFA